MAPSVQRSHNWQWIRRMFGMNELDGRHYFHSLMRKEYLREVPGTGRIILYDLAPLRVAYGRFVRELWQFIEKCGNGKAFHRNLSWLET